MKKASFKERFKYWFDNQMSKGTAVMIIMLTVLMFAVVLMLSLINGALSGFEEGTMGETVWTMLSTTINAWMPEADESMVTTILVSFAAIFGLFFTSFIIGIISSGVEDKLSQLRQGNSKVIEENHIVVLGFKPGSYTLLQQLILAAGYSPLCIVVAEEGEKTEMEEAINGNVEIPKNVRIICRNADITDPVSLSCASPETAELIIVQPIEDKKTVKALLAVSSYLEGFEGAKPRIVASVSDEEYMIPHDIRGKYGFTMLKSNSVVGRIIARSCRQPGLSAAFDEVFDYAGNELYLEEVPAEGKKFKDFLYFMKGGVPIGIRRAGQTILNPDRNLPMEEGDTLIVFEEKKGGYHITETCYVNEDDADGDFVPKPEEKLRLLVIGANRKLEHIISELPDMISEVIFADMENADEALAHFAALRGEIRFSADEGDILSLKELERMTEAVSHIILLCDEALEEEDADLRVMITLIKLRDIKERMGRTFTLTAEMRRDDDRQLLAWDDSTDFIVSANMLSMVLTQIAKCEGLYDTFHELLSSEGNEFELKNASVIPNFVGVEKNVAEIRRELIRKRCIFLGYVDENEKTVLNPPLEERIVLKAENKLIVIAAD